MKDSTKQLMSEFFNVYMTVTDNTWDRLEVALLRKTFRRLQHEDARYRHLSVKEFYKYLQENTPFRRKVTRTRPDNELHYVICSDECGLILKQ